MEEEGVAPSSVHSAERNNEQLSIASHLYFYIFILVAEILKVKWSETGDALLTTYIKNSILT